MVVLLPVAQSVGLYDDYAILRNTDKTKAKSSSG